MLNVVGVYCPLDRAVKWSVDAIMDHYWLFPDRAGTAQNNARYVTVLARRIVAGLTILMTGVAAAQSRPQNTLDEHVPTLNAVRAPAYRIGLNDVLQVDFPYVPEFNQTLIVHPDGYVNLKGVGDLYVLGMTTSGAAEAIQGACSRIMRDPVLTVDLKDYEKPYFVVSGKVTKPGKYDLRGQITVMQAIAVAGGFDDAAKHSQVLLLRRTADDWIAVTSLNAKAMLASHNLHEDVTLKSGDMIVVPKSTIAKLRPWIPTSSLGLFLNPL